MTEQGRGPSTMTRNEAADRLRRWAMDIHQDEEMGALVTEALATERRNAVNPLMEATYEFVSYVQFSRLRKGGREAWNRLRSILDDLATADVDEEAGNE